jgi:hypothetical protein
MDETFVCIHAGGVCGGVHCSVVLHNIHRRITSILAKVLEVEKGSLMIMVVIMEALAVAIVKIHGLFPNK